MSSVLAAVVTTAWVKPESAPTPTCAASRSVKGSCKAAGGRFGLPWQPVEQVRTLPPASVAALEARNRSLCNEQICVSLNERYEWRHRYRLDASSCTPDSKKGSGHTGPFIHQSRRVACSSNHRRASKGLACSSPITGLASSMNLSLTSSSLKGNSGSPLRFGCK